MLKREIEKKKNQVDYLRRRDESMISEMNQIRELENSTILNRDLQKSRQECLDTAETNI